MYAVSQAQVVPISASHPVAGVLASHGPVIILADVCISPCCLADGGASLSEHPTVAPPTRCGTAGRQGAAVGGGAGGSWQAADAGHHVVGVLGTIVGGLQGAREGGAARRQVWGRTVLKMWGIMWRVGSYGRLVQGDREEGETDLQGWGQHLAEGGLLLVGSILGGCTTCMTIWSAVQCQLAKRYLLPCKPACKVLSCPVMLPAGACGGSAGVLAPFSFTHPR